MAADSAEAVAVLCAALDVEYMAIREHISGPVTEVEERGTLYEMAALPTAHATWKAVLVLTDRDNTPAAVQVERRHRYYRRPTPTTRPPPPIAQMRPGRFLCSLRSPRAIPAHWKDFRGTLSGDRRSADPLLSFLIVRTSGRSPRVRKSTRREGLIAKL